MTDVKTTPLRISLLLSTAVLLCASTAWSAPGIGIAQASVEGDGARVAPALLRWLHLQIFEAGIPTIPIEAASQAALAPAAQHELHALLLTELRVHQGQAALRLVLVDPGSREVRGVGEIEVPLEELGHSAGEALSRVLAHLGTRIARPVPVTLDDLVCTSRAVALREAGDALGAYRVLQGKVSPLAVALRDEIVENIWSEAASPAEQARVIAAAGDPANAWRLISQDARAAAESPQADPKLLVAAGEVSLARGDDAGARRYFEAAAGIATGPVAGDAQLGLSRVAILQGRPDVARRALAEATRLRPEDWRPPYELSRLVDDPDVKAIHLVDAGRRAARALDAERARRHFRKASGLSHTHRMTALVAQAELESQVGRPTGVVEALAAAPESAQDVAAQLALGRAYQQLGDAEGSRAAYRRALELEPNHVGALSGLGMAELEAGRPEEGLRHLRRAESLDPGAPSVQRALARALEESGDLAGAVEVRTRLAQKTGAPRDLAALGASQLAAGDAAAARRSLDRAVAMRPYDPGIRGERARVLSALGSEAADDEASLAAVLRGSEADPGSAELDPTETGTAGLSLDELIRSFAVQTHAAEQQVVVSLGVRRPTDWKSLAERFLHPREPDLERIDGAIRRAIAHNFDTMQTIAPDDAGLGAVVDELYAFQSDDSLSAHHIAQVNAVLGADGILLSQLWTRPQDPESPLCLPGDYEIHMRLLMGGEAPQASILANVECLSGGHAAYGQWNLTAFGVIACIALVIFFPLLRGWGAIHVSIQLPQRTKGFFSIHINERPDMVVREVVDKNTGREKTRSKRLPDLLRRFHRHMAGSETSFRWIPARRSPYTVTIAGPLLDSKGDEIIGHFFQEQPVQVKRGRQTQAVFDLRPQECAVELRLLQHGEPAAGGRCAVRGDPSSVRYARDGVAYLYLGTGAHTLVVASEDAAAEIPLEITSLETAIPIRFDFAEGECSFQDCPEAVEPFVLGDLPATVDALVRAGHSNAANRLQAVVLSREGKARDAAAALEAAGETLGAAELRADGQDFEASAELFERGGDFDRAADAYRAAGQLEEAARCYEQVFDYANALECWREIGDSEREMYLLEKTGEFMEAATIAYELGDTDRALGNLQQIDSRHVQFADACDLIANIMIQRGDLALAIAKYEEALASAGADGISIKTLEGYAQALEQANRPQEALSAYEAIARRDVTRDGVNRRIETLRHTLAQAADPTAAVARSETGTQPMENRYELLEEIGRGGMGVVYKARDRRLGRIVALKRLPENLREHPNAVALFEREARAAAALNHVNIVTLFDAGNEDGSYFITMELLEGRPLNAILERVGQLSARDTARLGIQIATGLQYAHDQRIVHRDIKTSNLFFTKDATVKIMDFGIAKSLEEVRRSATVVGGTPYYMAPEQAAGEGVDHRADLYALGVTLFQLATGALPFGDGDVTYRHRHEAPPDPREFAAALPERLAHLIIRLMAKDREERPASAAEVAAELKTVLAELSEG